MKKIDILILGLLCMATSCASQYTINGTSSLEQLEGQMLYLKVFRDNNMLAIDSSQVVHGRFKFGGAMDSVVMANLYLGNMSLMPVVIEDGEVKVKLAEVLQSATGTPLNDTLQSFITRKTQLDARMEELSHKESRMVMDGMDHDEVLRLLSDEAVKITEENDQLVTRFITNNYDNVLGPGIFMIMTSKMTYPILNPQIESILSQGTPYFLSNPYVKEFKRIAEENMETIHQGGGY